MKKELEKNNNLHANTPSHLRDNTNVPKSLGRRKLESWLNKSMKIEMTDGRTLIGIFLCTDRDCNVILGSCSEYLRADEGTEEEPRVLGLAMVPGHHIVSICLDNYENERADIL